MISGRFGNDGELWFDLELIAIEGDRFSTEALFDTGFTTGWLAINSQDLEALQWPLIAPSIEMFTARGRDTFELYEGKIILEGREFFVPVHVGDGIPEILMGARWLEVMELTVNKPRGVLTLAFVVIDD